MSQQEQFEEWFSRHFRHVRDVTVELKTSAWSAWQAAIAAERERIVRQWDARMGGRQA